MQSQRIAAVLLIMCLLPAFQTRAATKDPIPKGWPMSLDRKVSRWQAMRDLKKRGKPGLVFLYVKQLKKGDKRGAWEVSAFKKFCGAVGADKKLVGWLKSKFTCFALDQDWGKLHEYGLKQNHCAIALIKYPKTGKLHTLHVWDNAPPRSLAEFKQVLERAPELIKKAVAKREKEEKEYQERMKRLDEKRKKEDGGGTDFLRGDAANKKKPSPTAREEDEDEEE